MLLPNSRSNQNQNQIKPKIWRGSIIAWFLAISLSCLSYWEQFWCYSGLWSCWLIISDWHHGTPSWHHGRPLWHHGPPWHHGRLPWQHGWPQSTMVGLPNTMVGLLNTMVGLPNNMVGVPNTKVGLLNTMVGLPNTIAGFPNTMVGLGQTFCDLHTLLHVIFFWIFWKILQCNYSYFWMEGWTFVGLDKSIISLFQKS